MTRGKSNLQQTSIKSQALKITKGESGENSLKQHFGNRHSRDVSTASSVCSRGSALNMTDASGFV
jgi:hypothetical protein